MPDANTPKLLLIEGTPSLRSIYEAHLRAEGWETLAAATASEGLALFRQSGVGVVLLDLMLPDRDGLDLMAEFLALRPATAVVVITADRSTDRAVLAMRAGAFDFLVKPVNETRLSSALENARRHIALDGPADCTGRDTPPGAFLGQSEMMQDVYARIRKAAQSDAPTFITGESGTGKELCARAIHDLSNRRSGPFITLDCAALPADQIEAEVFGLGRGVAPGASAAKLGAVPAADGGTLLLDNLCEMPIALQGKFLRFIEDESIRLAGETTPRDIDLRLICTSGTPPAKAIEDGTLREDLFYRLHVLSIRMPALRERPTDIAQLSRHLLARFAATEKRAFDQIDARALSALERFDWPGNVRQLMNVLRSAVLLHDGAELTLEMLPPEVRRPSGDLSTPASLTLSTLAGRSLAEIERLVIEDALVRHAGSVPRAAYELGIAPSTIYRKMDAWRLRDA